MTADLILVKITPMDREWVNRALHAVLGADQVELQRSFQWVVTHGFQGYTAPMSRELAITLADVIFAARNRSSERHWEASMVRLAERFRTQHVKAVKAKTGGHWVPEGRTLHPGPLRKRGDKAVLPEGEA